MPDPASPPFSIYPYDPSKVLPIVFAAIVLLLTLSLLHQSISNKWVHFGFMTTWAGVVWTGGFITRAISVFNPSIVDLYIAQYVLVFVGPPLYAASEYFILGRLLAYLPYHTPLHPGRVLSTFLMMSAIVESLAASGASASVTSNTPEERISALVRVKVSLILQEVVELGFCGMVALVEYRCRRAGHFPHNVRTMCRMLYITSLMMTVRCVLRTVEGFEATACDPYAPNYKGYCGRVQHYEWYLWVFEVANITVFVALLAIFHPGRYLPSDKNTYLDPVDGITERVGPGYSAADGRSLFISILDPFNLARLGGSKGAVIDKYWERHNPAASKSFAAGKGRRGDSGISEQATLVVVPSHTRT